MAEFGKRTDDYSGRTGKQVVGKGKNNTSTFNDLIGFYDYTLDMPKGIAKDEAKKE